MNWLSREQARDLLAQPEIDTNQGKRDRATLALLLGSALRRSELAALESRHIQRDATAAECSSTWWAKSIEGKQFGYYRVLYTS